MMMSSSLHASPFMSMSVSILAAMALAPAAVAAEGNPLISALQVLGSYTIQYSPDEWASWSVKERLLRYDWTREMIIFATLAVYLGCYWYGVSKNRKLVNQYVGAVDPVLKANFALVGAQPQRPIIKDSATRYTTYASGRINIESVLTRFRLLDRQNFVLSIIGLFVPAMRGSDGTEDYAYTVLTPTDPASVEPGVFAVVNKENMAESRDNNYFLHVTKTVDSDKLPSNNYTFMYEHSEQVNELYIPELHAALALPGAARVFQALAVSDMPLKEPATIEEIGPRPLVYLSTRFPSNSEEEEATAKIFEAAVLFVDKLVEKKRFRPEIAKRIKVARDAEAARIHRIEEESRKEELEAKKAEQRREAAKRERNLSEKEQRKLQKKEQDKQSRKQRQKMSRRS